MAWTLAVSGNGVDNGSDEMSTNLYSGDLQYAETVRQEEIESRQQAEYDAKLIEEDPSNDQQ